MRKVGISREIPALHGADNQSGLVCHYPQYGGVNRVDSTVSYWSRGYGSERAAEEVHYPKVAPRHHRRLQTPYQRPL